MTLRRAPIARALSPLFSGPGALPLLRAAWPSAVGPELAARTSVISLESATLVVRVPDARWGRILHRLRTDILQRLRETTGAHAPRALAFSEGRVAEPPPARAAAPTPRPLAVPDAVAAGAASIPDAEIRRAFLDSAGRYLSRTRSE